MIVRAMLIVGAAIAATLAFVLWDQRATLDGDASFPAKGETRFPTVTGANLSRQAFTLPEGFEGRLNIAMVAFKQRHQLDVNTWLPTAQSLAEDHDDVRYYELPTIERMNAVARSFVDNGMRAGIPDPVARDTTITLYVDKAAFMRSLDLPTDDRIYVLLVDRRGNVVWRSEGERTDEAEASLRSAISTALASDGTFAEPLGRPTGA